MKYADICNMDTQGRIVIPAKIRKILKINDGEPLQVELSGQEILLRKCAEPTADYRQFRKFLSILRKNIRHTVALCSDQQVLVSAGSYLPDGTPIPEDLAGYVMSRTEITFTAEQPPLVAPYREPVAALLPVYTEIPLALAVLSRKPLPEMELACARLIAGMIEHELTKEGEKL